MLYMVTFTINIPQMLAYIPYMDPMGYVGFHWYQLSIIDISVLIFWTCHGVVPVSGCAASPSPLASLALAPLPSWHRRGAPRRRGHQCCERQRRWRPQRGLRYTYLICIYIITNIYIYILIFVLCHNCNSLQYVDILTTSWSFFIMFI